MSNKISLENLSSNSSVIFHMRSSVSTRPRSFLSQFVMIITVIVLLVAFSPCVSSSPTPSSAPIQHDNNKIIYDSNAFMFDPNNYQTGSRGDSSSLSSSVHQRPISPPSFWYAQPRTHANQFLMSHVNDNEIIVPKQFTRFNNNNNNDDDDDDDDDDVETDDYIPSSMLVNKRSSYFNTRYPSLKKRKQLTKPPMEVMNEIVNSIYLKR